MAPLTSLFPSTRLFCTQSSGAYHKCTYYKKGCREFAIKFPDAPAESRKIIQSYNKGVRATGVILDSKITRIRQRLLRKNLKNIILD